MFADQLENGKWVVKAGAAVLIPNTGMKSTRVVEEAEICDAIAEVGGWKRGGTSSSAYRDAAKKWADKIAGAWVPGGSSHTEFLDLIRFHAKE